MKTSTLLNLSVYRILFSAIFFIFLLLGQALAQTTVTFNTPGTVQWTVPCGVSSISVQAWGSGAGGSSSGGGGGGAFASNTSIPVTVGTIYTIIVGSGSTGTGQFSEFKLGATRLVAAEGGGLGPGNNTEGGRASASIGTLKFSGGNGAAHVVLGAGGGGGGSAGSGGNGSNGTAGSLLYGAGVGGAGAAGGGAAGGNGGSSILAAGGIGGEPGGGGGEKGTLLGANGAGGNGAVKIMYTVQPLTVSYTSAKNFCSNKAIPNITPTIAYGTVSNFSISPALPAGLVLNTSTGIISGTPTVASPATVYTIRAVNACYTVYPQQTIAVTAASDAGNWSSSILSVCYNGAGDLLGELSGTVGSLLWQSAPQSTGPWSEAANGNFSNLTAEKYYRVIAQNVSCATDTSAVLKLGIKNMWTGTVDTDWFNTQNWSDHQLPEFTVCNTIRITNATHHPIITQGIAEVEELEIMSGAQLQVDSSGVLIISGSLSSPAQAIHAKKGVIEFLGTGNQVLKGNWFVDNEIKNLLVSRSLQISSSPEDSLRILGSISFENNSDADLWTHDNVILKSSFDATANLAALDPGNEIFGKITVERYISVGSLPGHHLKSWQLLAAPVTGISIRDAWQEGGLITSTPNGYGASISGPGGPVNGYDVASTLPSLKTFNPAGNNYIAVPNTHVDIYDPRGYMVFIRGDRSVYQFSGANSAPVPTILRAKGNIVRGPQISPIIPTGQFQTIANPYPSAIDFSTLHLEGGAQKSFIVWDPWLNGSYGLGGFQTITPINARFIATPGRFNRYVGDTLQARGGNDDGFIQSGQAFFMTATGTDGRVYFEEKDKLYGSSTVTREYPQTEDEPQAVLGANLFVHSGANLILADGNRAVFHATHSPAVDTRDAIKWQNDGENFGLYRQGKNLAVEFTGEVRDRDTLFYRIKNLKTATYTLQFEPAYFSNPALFAELVDQFTGERIPVSLTDSTRIQVQFTANVASKAADRFMLVFKTATVLPVRFVDVQARAADDTRNIIQWKVAGEENIVKYIIERSADGTHFQHMLETGVQGNPSGNITYQQYDEQPYGGTNYYRIRAVGQASEYQYSRVVAVTGKSRAASIAVFPNPVKDRIIALTLHNFSTETLSLSLWNLSGQMFYSEKIALSVNGNNRHQIHLSHTVSSGMYKLRWETDKGLHGFVDVLLQ